MQIAGVVVDSYKLPVFKKHLDAAGLNYVEHHGPASDTVLLRVTCESAIGIKPIIEAAHEEATRK